MTRFAAACAGAISLMAGMVLDVSGAHAAPPTVVPSPGYDARLQESRSARSAPPLRDMRAPVYPRDRKRLRHHHR